MAFKLKLKQVQLSGSKASPFIINDSLIQGAGDSSKRFVNVEDSYKAGTGEGLKSGGSGYDPFKIGKGGGNPTPKSCDEQFDKLDEEAEYTACVQAKEQEQNKEGDPPPVVEDVATGDSTGDSEIVGAK